MPVGQRSFVGVLNVCLLASWHGTRNRATTIPRLPVQLDPGYNENMFAPTQTDIERFKALARIALRHYDLVDPRVEFLRYNENLTFRVAAAACQEHFLLRIHRAATSNFVTPLPAAIESELLWLEALARDTGIVVQKPVRNRRGQPVTSIMPIGETVPLSCTLLKWVEGEPLVQEEPAAPLLCQRLGELIARLHSHASTWTIPAGFMRVTYGPEFLNRSLQLLKPGVEQGLFSEADLSTLRRTADEMISVISALGQDRQAWGPIHSDIQGRNILVHEGEVRPIDFSLCGFGHYMFDLGTALPNIKPPFRKPFLEGYVAVRSLPDNYARLIEAFCLFSTFNCFGFLLPDPAMHEWIARRVRAIAGNECQAFVRGEPFLSDLPRSMP